MLDALNSPAAPHVTRREDYKPPEWLVPDLALDFTLGAVETLVRARLDVVRNGDHKAPPLHAKPSDARISRASPTVPVTKLTWDSWAADTSNEVPPAFATPLTTQ